MEQRFNVRDLRAKERFVLDNEFFNGYVKILGVHALGVYCSLCRHADARQKSFPSIRRIAEEIHSNRQTVIDCVKALELFNIIRRERIGKQCTNRYFLIDKKHWCTAAEIVKSTRLTRLKSTSSYFSGLRRRLQESIRLTCIERKHKRKETQERKRKEIGKMDEKRGVFILYD